MTRVLLTEHTPRLDSGHGLRTYAVARALALEGPLEVIYMVFGGKEPAAEYLDDSRFRLVPLSPSRGARRALLFGRAQLDGVPTGLARGVSPELVQAGRAGGRTVIADGPVTGAAMLVGGVRGFVYCAHNLESSFRGRIGDRGLERQGLRRFERRLLERATESWMVSERDVTLARALCPGAALRVVPNAVDVAAIEPIAPNPAARTLLFVGSFDYAPNRQALAWLVDEVMPRVWATVTGARLRVVGRGLERPPSSDRRVEVHGFVESIRDAYSGCSCVVVPLLEGGGTPLKFIEALAYGLPVVATPVAAAGLDVRPGRHYLEGETADGFAAAVVEALRSGAAELACRGRKLVEESHSVEAVARAMRC